MTEIDVVSIVCYIVRAYLVNPVNKLVSFFCV